MLVLADPEGSVCKSIHPSPGSSTRLTVALEPIHSSRGSAAHCHPLGDLGSTCVRGEDQLDAQPAILTRCDIESATSHLFAAAATAAVPCCGHNRHMALAPTVCVGYVL